MGEVHHWQVGFLKNWSVSSQSWIGKRNGSRKNWQPNEEGITEFCELCALETESARSFLFSFVVSCS